MRARISSALAIVATACCACASTETETDGAPAPSTTATTASPLPLQASVLVEIEAGSAPALVRLVHDTTHYVTLGLMGAFFDKVLAGEEVGFQLAVSADILSQVKVGYCDTPEPSAKCVMVQFDSTSGPNALVPESAYTLSVDELPDDVWSLDIQAQATEPFLALRLDAVGTGVRSADVTLANGDTLHFELPAWGAPSPYARLPMGSALSSLTYMDQYGVTRAGSLEAALDGAYAYTVRVDTTVPDDSVASAVLE